MSSDPPIVIFQEATMKNIDRYDDEARLLTPDEETVAKQKKKRAVIKQGLKFAVKLIICHIVGYILYVSLFGSAVDAEVYYQTGLEKNIMAWVTTIAVAVISLITCFEVSRDGEKRRAFGYLLDTEKMSFSLFWRLASKDIVLYTLVYFLFQVPMCIFHHILGFYYLQPTVIEGFYVIDVGFMELTGIGFLGGLITALLFFLFYSAFRYLTYFRWSREKIRYDKGE